MSKIPLILLSGGLDSTYLLQNQLYQMGGADVLYVNGGQHPIKQDAELKARRKIIDHFNNNYPHKVEAEWECLNSRSIVGNDNHKWSQPPAWIMGALTCIQPGRHSELQIGYVNDDSLSFGYNLHHVEKAWYHLQKISVVAEEPVPIKFPLMYMSKVEILRNLDKRLLDDIWICETPKDIDTPCGKCKPCKLMKTTLHLYKERFDETVFTTRLLALRDHKPGFKSVDHTNRNYTNSRVGQDWFAIPTTGYKRNANEVE